MYINQVALMLSFFKTPVSLNFKEEGRTDVFL